MMKLSTMKKVVDTVDHEWRSSLAEEILQNWEYDKGTVYYLRASANFIFIFKSKGKTRYLRFNDSSERDVASLQSEMNILLYLNGKELNVVQPVKSLKGNFVETIETKQGTFHAVVFDELPGQQLETDDLNDDQFHAWGEALGKLHAVLKKMPKDFQLNRQTWENHLETVQQQLESDDIVVLNELQSVRKWANGLEKSVHHYGYIHYDFEMDNLRWNEGSFSALDFDESACSWYMADIANAVRDLFEEQVDLSNPSFVKFIEGYKTQTDLDVNLFSDIHGFIRMHKLVLFAKIIRSVNVEESQDHPDWLNNLRLKLLNKIDSYRSSLVKE
ncbi:MULTISPECIES: phosphotransferase enzyme family protein [unclassified Bacillus (in: firmicutes)]|uniref:phosphotransferase enzyme family protein n=1 Tax=unclassified Bacillus (in: firmicutes) TaxID=185979 RepID=UPI0008EBB0A3|nr:MULTISPECIES: phosphotransferase [unclassified Bacillus (in: firmicutes)]SFA85634.1 Ser/Thr protein kinase RdoA involved in Cpx stress response, MazF antagonist [Bacillus sp. UNCCL13]SFQ83484.1 Ser/Thr protein kinase RdoA involved in Cpx stress response, MazF antagonist [Bacillus sp. cl95]